MIEYRLEECVLGRSIIAGCLGENTVPLVVINAAAGGLGDLGVCQFLCNGDATQD